MFQCCCSPPDNAGKVAVVDSGPYFDEHGNDSADKTMIEAAEADPTPDGNQSTLAPINENKPLKDDSSSYIFETVVMRNTREEPWGLKVDLADGRMVHICNVVDGSDTPLVRHNAAQPAEKHIKAGDYITKINGVCADSVEPPAKLVDGLRHEMTTSMTVVVQVHRPYIFDVPIVKGEQPLGLELDYSNASVSLVILNINAGLIKDTAPQIQDGDRIMAVGSVEGSSDALLAEIRNVAGDVVLRISRPHLANRN